MTISLDPDTAWAAVEVTKGRFVRYVALPGAGLWFSAPDTAEALGTSKATAARMAARLPESEYGLFYVVFGRAIPQPPLPPLPPMTLVSERGWIELILTSRGPLSDAARAFLYTVWKDVTSLELP